MIFRKKSSIQPVTFQVVATENAEECMYLGTVNDSELTWTANTMAKYTNGGYIVKKKKELCPLTADTETQTLFYTTGIVTFAIQC